MTQTTTTTTTGSTSSSSPTTNTTTIAATTTPDHSNVSVLFHLSEFLIQDTDVEGKKTFQCKSVATHTANLWHARLVCECQICPISKFKRLSFTSHNNFVNHPFDMIHCGTRNPSLVFLPINGVVERKQQHLLNVAQTLFFEAQLPLKFWGECVASAAYLINRTPSINLKESTPYELLYVQHLN
ncbi:hypothetical protein CR513_31086, partial [Mucuna pruriens]